MTNESPTERILSAANTENLRRPNEPEVPFGIELNKATLTALENYEKHYQAWVKTDTDLAAAIEDYQSAERADRTALEQAARAGKAAPPAPNAPDMLRVIEFATIKAEHAREAANAAASKVSEAINADPHIMWRAMDAILESNETMNARLVEIRNLWSAEVNRHAALMRNMPFVIEGAKPELSFGNEARGWSAPSITWPEPPHLNQLTLRAMFDNIARVKDRPAEK